MIEFIFLLLGIALTFAFYGVFNLYPKKKDVFPRGKTTKGVKE